MPMSIKQIVKLQRMGRANWLARIDYDEMLSFFRASLNDEELAHITTGYAHCEIVARHGAAISKANDMIFQLRAKRAKGTK